MSFTLMVKWICGSQEAYKRAILVEKLSIFLVSISTETNGAVTTKFLIFLLFFSVVYAKSADLRSNSEFDGSALRDAKFRIQELITEWSRY